MLCGVLATLVNVLFEAGSTMEPTHWASKFDVIQGELLLEGQQQPGKGQHLPLQQLQQQQLPQRLQLPLANSQALPQRQEPKVPEKHFNWDKVNPELALDKGPILKLVQDAGITDIDESDLQKLPSWSDVKSLYGEEPIIWGYPEQCSKFQNLPNKALHFISTAGTFNTGTNLMSELLIANCHLPDHEKEYKGAGVRWQVIWGKHTPVKNETYRLTHRTYKDPNYLAENTFPVVMVRDPYKWMQSMCRHKYEAKWLKDPANPLHCPNLVYQNDAKRPFNVMVKYANFTTQYTSLVELWNEWYQAYFDAPFPRLVVRFEDLIYHPRAVVQKACECAGGQLRNKFRYIVESAKKGEKQHGPQAQRTSYLTALSRYGTKEGRYKGFQPSDMNYAGQHLNTTLMQTLAYPFHENAMREADT